jgi:DNA-binding Lrp family transcriptional regulator
LVSAIKDVEWKLISELIKNSRKSDRALAKAIGASQPTVSRLRLKLEKKVIMEYAMRPNLVELGFELLAVNFARLDYQKRSDPRLSKKVLEFVRKRPNIIFASTGKGMHSDRLSISIHRNYSDILDTCKNSVANMENSIQ